MTYINITKFVLTNLLEKGHSMIETCCLKNVIFIQTKKLVLFYILFQVLTNWPKRNEKYKTFLHCMSSLRNNQHKLLNKICLLRKWVGVGQGKPVKSR